MKEALWLFRRLRKYTLQAICSLALATAAGVTGTVDPLLMRHLIDRSLPSRRISESLLCVALIAACFIGRAMLSGTGNLFGFRVAQHLGQDLRRDLLERMSDLSAEWHDRIMLGEKISRFDSDVEQIAQFGADSAAVLVRIAVFFCLNLAIMLRLNASMTLTMLPLLPLFYFVRSSFKPLIQSRAAETQEGTGKAIGRIAEHLGAVPQLQLLGAVKARTSDSVRSWLQVIQAQWRQRRTEIFFSVAVTVVLGLGILVVLGSGVYKYAAGAVTIGTLVAFYAYATRIFEPLSTAMDLYARSERMLASARRVLEIMNQEPSVPDSGHVLAPAIKLNEGITLSGVSFRYSSDRDVLRDINLEIKAGRSVAMIGVSGSGKSTLARLLVRLTDPNTGSVFVDGVRASEYSLDALRKTICYVPQAPVLFRGTIRENLLYANPSAAGRQLEEVIEATQMGPILQKLPRGLDHLLQGGASGLSGGEQQRLAIARALLRDPAVLVLDEATSALDAPTEAAVLRSVRSLRPERTLIVISHRVKSLRWVDRFVVLEQGTIVAEGDHVTLHRTSRYYRSLADTRMDDLEFSLVERVICYCERLESEGIL
jgi:ABC-type multidrug transport system fused ATPase/permease subunit